MTKSVSKKSHEFEWNFSYQCDDLPTLDITVDVKYHKGSPATRLNPANPDYLRIKHVRINGNVANAIERQFIVGSIGYEVLLEKAQVAAYEAGA